MNERSGASSALSSIDLPLQPLHLRVGHGHARAAGTLFRKAEIGLDVEQVVLDARQHGVERAVAAAVNAERGRSPR